MRAMTEQQDSGQQPDDDPVSRFSDPSLMHSVARSPGPMTRSEGPVRVRKFRWVLVGWLLAFAVIVGLVLIIR